MLTLSLLLMVDVGYSGIVVGLWQVYGKLHPVSELLFTRLGGWHIFYVSLEAERRQN